MGGWGRAPFLLPLPNQLSLLLTTNRERCEEGRRWRRIHLSGNEIGAYRLTTGSVTACTSQWSYTSRLALKRLAEFSWLMSRIWASIARFNIAIAHKPATRFYDIIRRPNLLTIATGCPKRWRKSAQRTRWSHEGSLGMNSYVDFLESLASPLRQVVWTANFFAATVNAKLPTPIDRTIIILNCDIHLNKRAQK